LLLFEFIFFLEVNLACLCQGGVTQLLLLELLRLLRLVGDRRLHSWCSGHGYVLRVLLLVQALEKALPSLLHLDEPALEPLPQFVVFGAPHIGGVPHVVLYELLDLVLPNRAKHVLLNGFNRDHQSCYILNQYVISGDKQFLFLLLLLG
jgi:hypothetical protein